MESTPKKSGRPAKYTKEQLIEIMQNAPVISYDYFNSKDNDLPAATTYRRYFGSWSAALEAAGVSAANSTMKPDRKTTLYLVEFEDQVFKIGITQQTIQQRLGGRYPKYTIILEILFDTLAEAKTAEKLWLQNIREFKFVPGNFPVEGRGFTECFKLPD
jgi:hypothetical protein